MKKKHLQQFLTIVNSPSKLNPGKLTLVNLLLVNLPRVNLPKSAYSSQLTLIQLSQGKFALTMEFRIDEAIARFFFSTSNRVASDRFAIEPYNLFAAFTEEQIFLFLPFPILALTIFSEFTTTLLLFYLFFGFQLAFLRKIKLFYFICVEIRAI